MDDRPVYWRQHLHLLAAAALLPVFAGIYYLDFWLRFEGDLRGAELDCFAATVSWVVLVKLAWFVGPAGLSRLAPLGHLLRPRAPLPGRHRRPWSR